jgi:hypothetical protein
VDRVCSKARPADRADLAQYCLFWLTYLTPWAGKAPGFRKADTDEPQRWVRRYALAHLQWHRHRCLLWEGMRLRFEFDGGGAATATERPRRGDLVVTHRGVGIMEDELGTDDCGECRLIAPVESGPKRQFQKGSATETVSLSDIYGYIREWEFDLHRDEAALEALTRDELLFELLEIGEVNPTVVRAAAFHGEDDRELRRLLFRCLHRDGAASFKSATTSQRSGRACKPPEWLPAGAATASNTQDQLRPYPALRVQLTLAAWERWRSLQAPRRGSVIASICVNALDFAKGVDVDPHADYPFPYWLAVCQRDVTPAQWLGRGTFVVQYLEGIPQPIYASDDSGTVEGWEWRLLKSCNTPMSREDVLCQLPELDEPPLRLQEMDDGSCVRSEATTDGTAKFSLTAALHQRCCDAACRHTDLDLRVESFGTHTDVDLSGQYPVRCVGDANTTSALALRSHSISSKSLRGAELSLRITHVRLAVWPYQLPCSRQPAVLTLPGGAQARGVICAAPNDVDAAAVVSFETAVGRGTHACHNLRRVSNIHGLNGADAKAAEEARIEQNRLDLDRQGLDTAPLGWLGQGGDIDRGDKAFDEVAAHLAVASTAKLFQADPSDDNVMRDSPLTTRALAGLDQAAQRMRDDPTADGATLAAPTHAVPTRTTSAAAIFPTMGQVVDTGHHLRMFKRGLNKANRQGDGAAAVAPTPALNAGVPAATSEPPLIPAPPDGPRIDIRALATARVPCRLSRLQTLQTGAPDAVRGMPFGSEVNAKQGEAICNILDMLGFTEQAPSSRVGTTPSRSAVFDGVAPCYFVVGEPGTGKSVVVDAVRRHIESHGWTHDQFRVLAAMGKAAANVHGSTFASFVGQAGARKKLPKGARRSLPPPGIEPVFEEGQKQRLQKRNSRLRLIVVDEYEMLKLEDFATLLAILKASKGSAEGPSGGVVIVLVGDPFQLPAIGGASVYMGAASLTVRRDQTPGEAWGAMLAGLRRKHGTGLKRVLNTQKSCVQSRHPLVYLVDCSATACTRPRCRIGAAPAGTTRVAGSRCACSSAAAC